MTKHRAPMERIIIKKGVPCPPLGAWKPALLKMRVGDSFDVPNHALRGYVLVIAKRLGVAVTSRKVNGKGFEVWRVRRRKP